jgi:hypothetical protein
MTNEQRQKLIEHHRNRAATEWRRQRKWRAWYEGKFWDAERNRDLNVGTVETRGAEFETPVTYAYVQTMIANVVPSNPQVTVKPRRGGRETARRGREALANDALVEDLAHDRLWKVSTLTALDGIGFIKVLWSKRLGRPTWRVLSTQQVWFDDTAERWQDARYFIERVVLTRSQFEAKARPVKTRGRPAPPLYDPKVAEKVSFSEYRSPGDLSLAGEDDPARQVFQTVTVYEFSDFEDGKFYHILEGVPEPLMVTDFPYDKVPNPYIPVVFNDNTRNLLGISDIQLIESAQEVQNSLNALEVRHALSTIPVMMIDGGAVDEPSQLAKALGDIRNAGEGVVVQRSSANPVPLDQVLAYTRTPSLPTSVGVMRAEAARSMSFTLAIAEYQRGSVGNSEIATEVALADTSIRLLNGRRQTVIYDVIRWMGESAVALYDQFLKEDEIIDVQVDGEAVEIARADLAFGEESPEYFYRAIPYSAVENSRVVQSRAMTENLPITQWLQALGIVDARKWAEAWQETNRLPNVLTPPETLPPSGQPAVPTLQVPEGEVDSIATGALPAEAGPSPAGPRVTWGPT